MALAGRTCVLKIFLCSDFSCKLLREQFLKNFQCTRNISVYNKLFSSTKEPAKPSTDKPVKKYKPLTSPQITLISDKDDVSMMTLEIAEKLAKRRNLKLVKIIDFDTKTERPVYKIMTSQQFFEEDARLKEKKKNEKNSVLREDKLFSISTKIAEHDLLNKIKQMRRALKKRHSIRVFIAHDGNPPKAIELADIIEEELNELVNKKDRVTKMQGTIKLQLTPKLETGNIDFAEKKSKSIERENEENK